MAVYWTAKTVFGGNSFFAKSWGGPGVNFSRKTKVGENLWDSLKSTQFLMLIQNIILVFVVDDIQKNLSTTNLPDYRWTCPDFTKKQISQEWKRILKKGERTFVPRSMAILIEGKI
jgi:hypothetical protein